MKTILRHNYLQRLENVIGTPDIKVITGIRRSGKSELLKQFKALVRKSIPDSNIIHIDLALPQNISLCHSASLYQKISADYRPKVKNFLLVDEVQLCEGFEQLFNGLHAEMKYDIYITGSNAFLLSSDLATLFTGRTFEIEVFPFSLAEYMEYFDIQDASKALQQYIHDGGMAGSYLYQNLEDRYHYLANVYQTLIVKDIAVRYAVRNRQLLDDISNYLMDNIGNPTSVRNITNISNHHAPNSTSITTNSNYVKYLCESFAFYPVRRFDIKGKRYLASPNKYYLADHSFRYAILGVRNMDFGRTYENIVAIELLRRGYEVYTGNSYGNHEVDFIAMRRDEKYYIQVTDNLSEESTKQREISSLLKIQDAYPKIILANTGHEKVLWDGVSVVDLAEWLAGKTAF